MHSELVYNLNEDVNSFENALELENLRKKGLRIPKGARWLSELFYSERVSYLKDIKRYTKYFPKSQIKIIIFDDFKKNNLKVFEEVLEFLKINGKFKPKLKFINTNKRARFKKLTLIIGKSKINKSFKRNFPNLQNLLSKIYSKANTKYLKRSKMNLEINEKLKKKFVKEVKQLSIFLKRDLIKEWDY